MAEHTVTIDAYNVTRPSDEQLAELLDALIARPELLGPSVSANERTRSIGLIATVDGPSERGARFAAISALGEEMMRLGLIGAWVLPGPGEAVILPEHEPVSAVIVDG